MAVFEELLDVDGSTITKSVGSLFPKVNVWKREYKKERDDLAESSVFIFYLCGNITLASADLDTSGQMFVIQMI